MPNTKLISKQIKIIITFTVNITNRAFYVKKTYKMQAISKTEY